MPEITRDQIDQLGQNTDMPAPELDSFVEVPVWEQSDAPAGSTSESLLVFERGVPVRVSGPTHYAHLTDGRVVASYGHGTVFTEAVPGGPDRATRIIDHFGG